MLNISRMTNELGSLLRRAREAKGLTQGEVGAHVGVTYSAIGQYESGTIKQPKPHRIAAMVEYLGIDRDSVSRLVAEKYGFDLDAVVEKPSRSATTPQSNIEYEPGAPSFRSLAGRTRSVPELGIAVAGRTGDFSMNGEVVGRVPLPAALVGRDIFAVRVKNDSMYPRFREGELVYVENRREPVSGEDAIIELHPGEEHGAGPAFIKELVSKGTQAIVALQHNPKKTLTYKRGEVKKLYRVIPWNEVLGT